jgi:transposase
MSRKIYVTASEMRTMREEGMSNRDIANALDISYATVVKYIGKQGRRRDSLDAFRDTPPKKTTAEKEVAVMPRYEPKAVHEQYLIGDNEVDMDSRSRVIMISGVNGEIALEYDSVPELVQFLVWAMRERMEVNVDAQTEEVRE